MQQKIVGPRIVRAWFDTIINPLLAALDVEKALLEEHNYSWQYYNNSFEWIKKVREHVTPEGCVNLEQFLECNIKMNDPVQKHDADVEDLNKRVVDLHDVLVKAIRNMTDRKAHV